MLVDFRVKNFGCLREEQRLRLAATSDRTLAAGNTAPTDSRAAPRVVRSILLYGANASGKSTLFRAIGTVRDLVLMRGEGLSAVRPFDLDAGAAAAPTGFDLCFFSGGTRYRYSLSCTRERVLGETLVAYETRRPSVLYQRTFEDGRDAYRFGGHLSGGKKVCARKTAGDELFLARFIESTDALPAVERWFRGLAVEPGRIPEDRRQALVGRLGGDDALRARVSAFLREAGTGVGGLAFREGAGGKPELLFRHGRTLRPIPEEAEGVRKLTAYLTILLSALDRGGVVCLDGLEGLHPLLCRKLFALFHEPSDGTRAAQFFAATHETSLLQTVGSLLRRDQIWFMEKTADESSELFSLVGFAPRKGEAVERGYLQGRYGALP